MEKTLWKMVLLMVVIIGLVARMVVIIDNYCILMTVLHYWIWLVVFGHPSETYKFVSWGDELPNWLEK